MSLLGKTKNIQHTCFNDSGGASRFFKQFTTLPMNTTSDNMNTDLADYLTKQGLPFRDAKKSSESTEAAAV